MVKWLSKVKLSPGHTFKDIQLQTVNQSKSTTLERSVKTLLEGLNRFYVAKTLALSSTVEYTGHFLKPVLDAN